MTTTMLHRPETPRTRRGRLVCSCAAALALATLLPVAPARATEPELEQVAVIESRMLASRRHLNIDASARRLFEIGQQPDVPGMSVVATDLDGFSTAAEIRIPGSQSGVGGALSAVDELRHRLYVLYPRREVDDSAIRGVLGAGTSRNSYDEHVRTLFGVAAIDTLRGTVIGTGTLAMLAPVVPADRSESNRIGIKAMSYHRLDGRDTLYLVSEVPVGLGNLSLSAHSVTLHEIDVARLLDPSAPSPVSWSYRVPACSLTMARAVPGVVYRSASSPTIFIPCRQGGLQSSPLSQPLETPGVVRVTAAPGRFDGDVSAFAADFFPVSGNLQYGMATVDPRSERLFLKVEGSATEAGIWVFDTRASSWLGLVSLAIPFVGDGLSGLAVDSAYGRLHALASGAPTALATVTRTRGAQVDQGQEVRFATNPTIRALAPVVDPYRHRVFAGADGAIVVVQDRLGPTGADLVFDPDAGTNDIAEGADTAVNYVGGAQAFGARIRWVGGSRGVDRNLNTVWENPPPELSPNTGGILPQQPAPGTRDLHMARVIHATLANGEATAKATGAERDLDNTDADLAGWTNYMARWGGPDLTAQRWPYEVAECTDFGGPDDQHADEAGGATVTCERARAEVSAAAVENSLSRGDQLIVTESRARTSSYRDPVRGIVSVAEAEVIGLRLTHGPATVGIGRILARAETHATGRPVRSNKLGARGTFRRTFEHVWVTDPDGARRDVCAVSCDPEVVRDELNRALGLRVRVELPEPDAVRAKGTPGGFEALVVRSNQERANDASVNDEADERRLEVPAIVVTAFADGRVPSRVVVSLAGVAAESHYGIFPVSSGVSFDPRPRRGPTTGPIGPGPSAPPGGRPDVELPGNPFTRTITKTLDGLRFILASPVRAVRAFGLWAFLALPVLLLLRRRSMARWER